MVNLYIIETKTKGYGGGVWGLLFFILEEK